MLALFNTDSHILICSVPDQGRIDHIPPHVYTIAVTQQGIVLNKDRKRFNVPEKTYGEHENYRTLITDDFMETPGVTGVILNGLKGSGKSMLAEDIGNSVLSRDIPVLMITEALPAEILRTVISIVGPCMVYFDEFGKVYSEDQRKGLLTLFSDTELKKVLFVLTSNHTEELNDFMINRPGRFKYAIAYQDLTAEVVDALMAEYTLEAPVKEMLQAYVREHTLSIDMFQHVLKAASKLGNLDAVVKRMRILNVPGPVVRTYRIDSAHYKGERFYGDVMLTRNGDSLSVEFYRKGCTDILAGGEINFTEAKRLLLSESGNSQVWRVTVNDDLVIELTRGWVVIGGAQPQGRTIKGKLVEKKDDGESSGFPSLLGMYRDSSSGVTA